MNKELSSLKFLPALSKITIIYGMIGLLLSVLALMRALSNGEHLLLIAPGILLHLVFIFVGKALKRGQVGALDVLVLLFLFQIPISSIEGRGYQLIAPFSVSIVLLSETIHFGFEATTLKCKLFYPGEADRFGFNLAAAILSILLLTLRNEWQKQRLKENEEQVSCEGPVDAPENTPGMPEKELLDEPDEAASSQHLPNSKKETQNNTSTPSSPHSPLAIGTMIAFLISVILPLSFLSVNDVASATSRVCLDRFLLDLERGNHRSMFQQFHPKMGPGADLEFTKEMVEQVKAIGKPTFTTSKTHGENARVDYTITALGEKGTVIFNLAYQPNADGCQVVDVRLERKPPVREDEIKQHHKGMNLARSAFMEEATCEDLYSQVASSLRQVMPFKDFCDVIFKLSEVIKINADALDRVIPSFGLEKDVLFATQQTTYLNGIQPFEMVLIFQLEEGQWRIAGFESSAMTSKLHEVSQLDLKSYETACEKSLNRFMAQDSCDAAYKELAVALKKTNKADDLCDVLSSAVEHLKKRSQDTWSFSQQDSTLTLKAVNVTESPSIDLEVTFVLEKELAEKHWRISYLSFE